MFKDMGNEIDKKMSEYKKNIDEYKEKLGIDEILKDYEDTEFNLDEWFKEKGKILTTPKVKIGLVNKSTNDNPEFATNGASGFDLRADLPTIGTDTLKDCKRVNIKGVVLKANQNIFLDKKKCIDFANKNKMFIKSI